MVQSCFVTLSITTPQGEVLPPKKLGEFKATWTGGVSIGSDVNCDIVLNGLLPVAAIVLAASNHKLLYRHGTSNFAKAVEYAGGPIPEYDQRVDYRSFDVADYTLQFGEDYQDVNDE